MINKRETKRKNNLLLGKVVVSIRGRLISIGVLLVGGLMLFNVAAMSGFNVNGLNFWGLPLLVRAANSDLTNLNVTIQAGSLEIVNVPADLQFAAGTAGTTGVSFNNLDDSTIRDFRSSPVAWNLRAYSAELNNGISSDYNIANSSIALWPGNADKVNVASFDTGKVGNGTNNTTLDANILVFNSSHNAVGAIRFDNLLFRLEIDAGQVAQDLNGDLTLVVI